MGSCEDRKEVQDLVLKQKGKVFIDIGANEGYYVFKLSKKFKEIFAIEPYPPMARYLEQEIKRRGIRNTQVLPFVISNRSGKATFYLSRRGAKCHSLLKVGIRSIEIPCYALNQLFPNKKIDLIKVDVEGSEFEVVLGADMLLKNIKSWIIEIHDIPEILEGKKHNPERLEKRSKVMDKLLKEFGYETEWISNRWVYARRKKDARKV